MKITSLPHNHADIVLEERLIEKLPDEIYFTSASDIMKLLCDTSRSRIFWVLCHSEECVINLSALLNMSSPAVSHHLKLLKNAGLIVSRRDGKEVYYRASDTDITGLLHLSLEKMMEISCPRADEDKSSAVECEISPDADKIIERVHEYLAENLSKRITIVELSRRFAINPTTLKEKFREAYGKSIAAHIREHRMSRAAQLLATTDMSVGEVSEAVGYTSQSRFTAAFAQTYGVTAGQYRIVQK